MRDNYIELKGFISSEAKVKVGRNGRKYLNFGIYVDLGINKPKMFMPCVLFGDWTEHVAAAIKVNDYVGVSGKVELYTTKDKRVYDKQIVVEEVEVNGSTIRN